MRLLVVEDDPDFLDALELCLRLNWESWDILRATNGSQATDIVKRDAPELIILDLNLPDTEGTQLCRTLRAETLAPIMILTCRSSEMDKVRGLEAGADDYVTKPFGAMELQARLRALLRRSVSGSLGADAPPYSHNNLTIDFGSRQVWHRNRPLRLTPTEYGLLYHLIQNAPNVLSHETLLMKVWGPEYRTEKEYVRVHIQHLRQKLHDLADDPHFITTVRGLGYRFAGPRPQATAVHRSTA
jgi:two-component system, OmpR family, KDP operon response regulator KdpE